MLKLCRTILKSAGKKGLPQGSVIGPLFANVYLNDLDKTLEKAREVTKYKQYDSVRYARFADDRAPRMQSRRNLVM